jgi:SAM-dependent methyltransferase
MSLKRSIGEYLHLHWNFNICHQEITRQYYIGLKNDLKELQNQEKDSVVKFPITKLYPCYRDKEDNAGALNMQDLHVAQLIYKNNPVKHVDIGSCLNGFISHVASFRKIEVFDIRPMQIHVSNIEFTQADLMKLDKTLENYADSVSCLSVLEHFGLGRYNDPICYDGYLVGFDNIKKILKKNGKFYFSIPMGEQRIEFNAHRVFSLKYLYELISNDYNMDAFSYIDDKNQFFPDITLDKQLIANNCNCRFGNAIFELTKK